jgi:putative flippase GtrA
MGRRLHRLAAEGAKFLTVGGVATVVALVLFNVLVHGLFGNPPGPMNNRPLTAFVLANLLGMLLSYRASRLWTFRHREVVGAVGGLLPYSLINTVTMAVPLLCLTVSRYLLRLDSVLADNLAANVVGLGLGTVARFWAFRRFVFQHPRPEQRRQLAS